MARKSEKTEVRDLENFDDIMGLTASDVQEPELYPEGPWAIRNVGFNTSDVEDRDHNPQLLVNLRYEGFEPGEEVDPELVEAGGFEGRTLWVKRYISKPAIKAAKDGSLARFVKFVKMHGIDTDGLDLTGMCKALKGGLVSAQIGTREYERRDTGEKVRDNTTGSFASVEAE